jgi:outer membrane protein assembly factor BamB
MPRAAALLLTLAVLPPAAAQDWPRFRGPNGSGVGEVAKLGFGPADLLWKCELPGSGHSSPIVVGKRVFLQSATDDGSERLLVCVAADSGKVLWTAPMPGGPGKIHAKSSLASSTPTSDGERVFVAAWDGRGVSVYGYTLDGNRLWVAPLGRFNSQHGFGGSAVAACGKVFVNFDQDGVAEFVALDPATGKKVWSAPRKPFRACSSCPLVREADGKPEVVIDSTAGLTGYDPDTGKVNWNWDWPFDGMALRTVGSPVLADGLIVATSGDGGGSRAAVVFRPGASQPLWEKTRDTPYVPGPVVLSGHIYWLTDDGFAMCVELLTGKPAWDKTRVFNRPVSASLVLAGGVVVAVAEDGKVVGFKPTPAGFEKVVEGAVGEAVLATPAVADGKVFIRGRKHLFCFGGK